MADYSFYGIADTKPAVALFSGSSGGFLEESREERR
jgi:hypothetical protein